MDMDGMEWILVAVSFVYLFLWMLAAALWDPWTMPNMEQRAWAWACGVGMFALAGALLFLFVKGFMGIR